MANKSYEDLIVWKKSIAFAATVIKITRQFPAEEKFGLTQQLRRAAVSIGSNIAEGWARDSAKEFAYFLTISKGSVAEVKTQIHIAFEVGYLAASEKVLLLEHAVEIEHMLHALIRKL